jgi:hypothetical protein
MDKTEEISVSLKIVREIINYAEDKIDTPFDYWHYQKELLKTGMDSETRGDMLQAMKNQDESEKTAMKAILKIIEKHLNS